MKLKCLGSSSSGNCYILENDFEALVIEAGIPFMTVKKALDFNINKIVGVLVSHQHLDHAKYSAEYEKAGIPVFRPYESDMERQVRTYGEFVIKSFPLVHDVPCCGFLIRHPETGKVLYARLYSMLDLDRVREYMVEVHAQVPEFRYGRYMDHENFLIALQSKFIPNDDRERLLRFTGTVENGTVAQYGDDGVTQKATIKTGIASKGEAIVPNPVRLRPFRTFIEVEQPESAFVFRMRQDGDDGVECAIFEADGGAWKNAAMKNIKEYLQFELSDLPQFTVIS